MHSSIARILGVLAAAGMAGLPAAAFAKDLGVCGQTNSIAAFKPQTTTTSATSFAALPGTNITRTMGNNGCTVVEFSAQVDAAGGVRIRLLVDGNPAVNPASVDLYGATDVRTVRFPLPKLTNGLHTFAIEYMSIKGSAVSLGKYTTIVYYDLGT